MMRTLAGLSVAATPFLVVAVLVWLADLIQRRTRERIARQVALTDAIHRELGAAAAPTVHWRPGGRWLVTVALPLDRPDLVAAIVRVVDRAWAALPAGGAPFEIALRPRPTLRPSATGARRLRATKAAAAALR